MHKYLLYLLPMNIYAADFCCAKFAWKGILNCSLGCSHWHYLHTLSIREQKWHEVPFGISCCSLSSWEPQPVAAVSSQMHIESVLATSAFLGRQHPSLPFWLVHRLMQWQRNGIQNKCSWTYLGFCGWVC